MAGGTLPARRKPLATRSSEELQAIARWEQAAEHAKRAVFRQMQIAANNAFFELHIWNSRTR